MKKIEQLQNEISENIKLMKQKKENNLSYRSIVKKNNNLKFYLMYLQTNPSEEYLKTQKNSIQKIINSKKSQFNHWSENVCPQNVHVTKRRSLFNKELGINELRNRLQALDYILS